MSQYYIIAALMAVYSGPETLSLVINSNNSDKAYFTSSVEKYNPDKKINFIDSKTNQLERNKQYSSGGIHFVTSRILIVDILRNNIPLELISTVIVLNSQHIQQTSVETFILSELETIKSQKIQIKAFTDSAYSFTFSSLTPDKYIKNLQLKDIYLYPRYHVDIGQGLKKYSNHYKLFENCISFDKNEQICHQSIVDLLTACIIELNKMVKNIDVLSIDEILSNQFKIALEIFSLRNTDAISKKNFISTIEDIKTLKKLLWNLVVSDSWNFYCQVSRLMENKKKFTSNVGWIFLNSFQQLLDASKTRLLQQSIFKPQVSLKWLNLFEIIKEIDDIKKDEQKKIMIIFHSQSSYNQYLIHEDCNEENLYFDIYKEEAKYKEYESKYSIKRDVKSLSKKTKEYSESFYLPNMVNSKLYPVYSPIHDKFQINESLEELQPSFIIIFDPIMQTIRQVERYCSAFCSEEYQVEVSLLFYEKGIDRIAYFCDIQRENEAFEYLIKEKATIVIPEEKDLFKKGSKTTASDLDFLLSSNADMYGNENNEKEIKKAKPSIIVDMREFRSELPAYLHKKEFKIDPHTLEVGDYLLSNQICVERKTVIDFLASINSGRLYNQCTAMQNFYQKPLLLIETGADNLSPFKRISSVEKKLMINNLVLIAMHFPLLNIIWSPSIYFTSEIFTYLKDKQPEPISADCISSSDQENNISTQMCKLSIMRFLSKLPGIDSKTIFSLKNSGKITKAIISNNLQDLILIIGSSQNASAFYKFVNKEFSIDDIEDK